MPLEEPGWWYAPGPDPRARILAPLGQLYGWIAERRYRRAAPFRSRLPVVCIGNFTAGGTGKTPLCLLLAREARSRAFEPAFLTRGFGGSAAGPLLVAPGSTTAAAAGDEPLLLARSAPTVVARDRAAGARLIEEACPGVSLIIMDDGLQNGSLAKDLTIAVVDGARGIGNGAIIPAGPLRAPLSFQLELVDAIVVNTPPGQADGRDGVLGRLRQDFQGPVLAAGVAASGDTSWLAERPVAAFAGIGHPERFFSTLRQLGADVKAHVAFPDHHVFSEADARRLLALAQSLGATLVTTEKDLTRLEGGSSAGRELAEVARALPIELQLDERDLARLHALIDSLALKSRR